MQSIGSDAFYNCSGLISLDLPNSLQTIESYAFYNCSGLTSLN
ncbi:MAG: leucine-rich repeat domain-containing protein [Lachnospiraceae bacterium]|nr:leucine-rich repeat domain-containing protein [Lachnospiraceae bacterium]